MRLGPWKSNIKYFFKEKSYLCKIIQKYIQINSAKEIEEEKEMSKTFYMKIITYLF